MSLQRSSGCRHPTQQRNKECVSVTARVSEPTRREEKSIVMRIQTERRTAGLYDYSAVR